MTFFEARNASFCRGCCAGPRLWAGRWETRHGSPATHFPYKQSFQCVVNIYIFHFCLVRDHQSMTLDVCTHISVPVSTVRIRVPKSGCVQPALQKRDAAPLVLSPNTQYLCRRQIVPSKYIPVLSGGHKTNCSLSAFRSFVTSSLPHPTSA